MRGCASSDLHYPDLLSSPPMTADVSLSNFESVNMRELRMIVMISPSKSDVVDSIPTWLLKYHFNSFVPCLIILVNSALDNGMPTQ
jgi:hypothetical protein